MHFAVVCELMEAGDSNAASKAAKSNSRAAGEMLYTCLLTKKLSDLP